MIEAYRCRFCQGCEGVPEATGIQDWEYGFPGAFEYRRCRGCGGVQLHPFPELEDLEEAYRVDYHGYAEGGQKSWLLRALVGAYEWWVRRGLRPLVPPGARVLDVGCGAGHLLAQVRELGAGHVEGIDFSPRACALLEAKGIPAYQGTFLDYPAPAEGFDLVFMNNYLEHTLEPRAELEKARDLLKPGGALAGEVPGYDSPDRRLFGPYWGGNHVPRHTFQFDQGFLRRLLAEAGYQRPRIQHSLSTGHWALSVQNYLVRYELAGGGPPASLRHGRAWYFHLLLLAFLPVHVPCVLAGKSSVTRFVATRAS